MLTLTYTTKGYVKCGCDELAAGKVVDLPINITNIPTLPESIRGVVQTVVAVEVEGVEGRTYEIEYDEADLLGLISLLEPEEVDLPICVSDYTLAKEYIDITYGTLPDDVETALSEGAASVDAAIATIPFEPFNGYIEAVAGVAASGTLTITGDVSAAAESVTVGSTTMITAAFDAGITTNVIDMQLLGITPLTDVQMASLVADVINGNPSSVPNVSIGQPSPSTEGTAIAVGSVVTFTANDDGVAGNAIATTENLTNGSWGATTLEGGVDEVTEAGSEAHTSRILYNYFDQKLVTPSTNGNVFVDVEALVDELTLPAAPPEGRSFRIEATVTVTADEALNDQDSSALFVLVGQVGNGGTVSTIHKQEANLDTITATRVGQGLQIGFDNNGTSDKRMFVQTKLTAFNHL